MVVLLTAIWPSFKNIPNHIPLDQGIKTHEMVGFLLYFLLQLPFLCIPYTKVQYFFGFKSIIAPIIFLAIFGDTLRRAGGTVSHSTVITDGDKVGGSILAWAFFSSMCNDYLDYCSSNICRPQRSSWKLCHFRSKHCRFLPVRQQTQRAKCPSRRHPRDLQ